MNAIEQMKYNYPNVKGKFGQFGGKFVPETLMSALYELEEIYNLQKNDPEFLKELSGLQKNYNGRPTPLTFADRLTKHYAKAKIYLKREDLCHTGAHKMNNTLGQILLKEEQSLHHPIPNSKQSRTCNWTKNKP